MKLLDTQRQEMDDLIAAAERRLDAVRFAVRIAGRAESYDEWTRYLEVARAVAHEAPGACYLAGSTG